MRAIAKPSQESVDDGDLVENFDRPSFGVVEGSYSLFQTPLVDRAPRFRTCLKLADSKDANLVGKLFFNVMQMKCFVFKPETVCTKKSWWGTCERKGRRKRAVLRHNRKF
uniref:phospholipase A2 n=1 Tax=Anopheles epiroticus TaxID=199890 RepID=A0A182P023_9DIPT